MLLAVQEGEMSPPHRALRHILQQQSKKVSAMRKKHAVLNFYGT